MKELKDFFRIINKKEGKLKVSEVFRERGCAVPLTELYPTVDAMKECFDKPEELTHQQTPVGIFLIHKRDEDYLRLREEIVKQVLRENPAPKTIEEVMELRSLIEKKIVERN